ncbi:MAG: FecR domain-containing protein [Alphaproteobacteria bacterium]|nr:FecR domain-containing protein [Alphaproteobacteria bacterium]
MWRWAPRCCPASWSSRSPVPPPPGATAAAEGIAGAQPIGTVETADGTVLITHLDGTHESAGAGSPVYQGDVIETGSGASVLVVFADGTTLAIGQDSQAILDELIYDPEGCGGEGVVSLLEGTFSLVSGEIAESAPDAMVNVTPVAICGVRGTKVALHVTAAAPPLPCSRTGQG